MLDLLGMLTAAVVSLYTLAYAGRVWRREKNPLGAAVVAILGLACLVLPFYILYLQP